MGIQKHVKGPSPASQRRGRRGMPSVQRRVSYQAAEEGRESVQMVDSGGHDLDRDGAIDKLGGADSPYVELVSDLSSLETQALQERHPDQDPEEVARGFFAAQARELEEKYYGAESRLVVAVHGEPDGTYHAHMLFPGSEESLREALAGERQRNLEGQHGQAQAAFDRAWSKDMQLGLDRRDYARLMAEQKAYREQISTLRKQAHASQKESAERIKATAMADGKGRLDIQREAGEKERIIADRIHALEVERINKFWDKAGKNGSLEHLVYLEREEYRYRGDARRADARIAGVNVARARQGEAGDREAFRHLNARQREKVREKALVRELTAVRTKHEIQVRDMDRESADYIERVARQEHEIRGILLRHEAAKLGDRERDLSRASRSVVVRVFTSSTQSRLMVQRHDLEWQALQARSLGQGKSEPTPEARAKLDARQAGERTSSRDKGLRVGTGKIGQKAKSVARRTAQVPGKAVQAALSKLRKLSKKTSKEQHRHGLHREADQVEQAAQSIALGVVQSGVKVATTVTLEAAKAALHQARHAAQAVAVTAKAVVTGVLDPAAGAKVASEGYAKVGGEAVKTGGKDLAQGAKKTSKAAASATRDTFGQALGAVGNLGTGAAPPEVRALLEVSKETAKAMAKMTLAMAKGAITLDPIAMVTGTAKEGAQGALKVGKAAGKNLTAKLPPVLDKPLEAVSKIPLLGLPISIIKIGAEAANGLSKGGPEVGR